MKKCAGIILSVIGIVIAAFSLMLKMKGQTSVAKSVSVIGGADGPTSIFIAGKIGNGSIVGAVVVGIVLLAAGIFLIVKGKHKSNTP